MYNQLKEVYQNQICIADIENIWTSELILYSKFFIAVNVLEF